MNNLETIIDQFEIEGDLIDIQPISEGLINRTYHIYTTKKEYLLQKINTNIFKDIDLLMKNIEGVTDYLVSKDIDTLHIVYTKDHLTHYNDYRMYDYVLDSFTYTTCESKEAFYLCGKCFGQFHANLKDYDGFIEESIPHFHDTRLRVDNLKKVLETTDRTAKEEVDYLLAHEYIADLPLNRNQICHNDTKLSNILFNKFTKEPICIIDLDTLMPGSIGYDYGDALRSGANTTLEDDPDLNHVDFNLEYFFSFTKGFIEGLGKVDSTTLNDLENGLYMIIYEQSVRFLTDYLEGDTYYSIRYPTHNLVRARNQLYLLQKTLEKKEIIHEYIQGVIL